MSDALLNTGAKGGVLADHPCGQMAPGGVTSEPDWPVNESGGMVHGLSDLRRDPSDAAAGCKAVGWKGDRPAFVQWAAGEV